MSIGIHGSGSSAPTPTGTQNVDVTANTVGLATGAKQDTLQTTAATINDKTPALGQALAAASTPVVLTAAQIATLTPLTTVGVNNFPATQPVSAVSFPLPTGAATETTLAGVRTVLDGVYGTVNGAINAADQVLDTRAILFAVSPGGTYGNIQRTTGGNLKVSVEEVIGTIPVSGPITDAQIRATALPVSGTFFQATQPVSLATVPTHEVTSATAINFKSQSETYQGGVAVSSSNPLYTSDFDAELGLAGGHTNLRDRLVAQRYTVLSDSIADGLAAFWTSTVANGGTNTVLTGEGLLQTSANALGSAQLSSTSVIYYPGQSAWLNSAIRFGDTGSVGNIRRIGAFTVSGTTPQDGFYYELTGTTLNAVSVKGGVATAVASGSWTKFSTAPFTLTTNYHQFEIRFTSNSCQFYIDNVLRHTASGGSSSITSTLNFPITLQNINSSGATNRVLAVRNICMGRFGNPDAIKDATDMGRTAISLNATGVTAGTSATEAMVSFTRSTFTGAATSSATSFVIPIGKTFRITAIMVAIRNMAATTATTTFTFRINTAGAAVTTSNLALSHRCATPATINSWDRAYIDILDGIDIAGNGVIQFGMSVNPTWTTTASQYDINIIGYEY